MKKKMILILVSLLSLTQGKLLFGGTEYTSFQEVRIYDGKLLKEYSEIELKQLYSKVGSRKFNSWQVYYLNKKKKITFKSETLFSYYNAGTSVISYNYSATLQEVSKVSISSTGSISYSFSADSKKFKNGLNASLKIEASYQNSVEKKETINTKFDVEPGCCATLYMSGEGLITNGVAARYLFWCRQEIGGFEVFELGTIYQRLEIVRI